MSYGVLNYIGLVRDRVRRHELNQRIALQNQIAGGEHPYPFCSLLTKDELARLAIEGRRTFSRTAQSRF